MRRNETAADKPAAPTVKKTVTVNAYAEPGRYGSEREFAADLDTSNDYWATTAREKRERYAVLGDLEIDLCRNVYQDIQQAVDEGFDIGDAYVEERVRTTSEHDRSPHEALGAIADDFCESVPDRLDGGVSKSTWNSHAWEREGDYVVLIRSSQPKERQVLTHHDRRTPDNRFEGEEAVMSAQWTVSLGPGTEAEIEAWGDTVTAPFIDYVARLPAVQKVRIADCKERVERDGDCFDV